MDGVIVLKVVVVAAAIIVAGISTYKFWNKPEFLELEKWNRSQKGK